MKKKGFTLIELLAVIVILAVILTIAVPAVKKTVDSAKKKTAENNALMIKGIAERYYTSNLESDEELTGVDLTSNTLSYSGEKPSKGYLFFTDDGVAYGKMYLNGYCVEVNDNGSITSEKVDEEKCSIGVPTDLSCFKIIGSMIIDYKCYEGNTYGLPTITDVVIPNSVTDIGPDAFKDNKLTNVTIPNSVITIGAGAFYRNQLTNITIPNSVTTIGEWAFLSNELTNVTIPNSVTRIGAEAFSSNKITSIEIPDSVISLDGGAFNNNLLPDSQAYIYARTDTNKDGIAEIDATKVVSYGGAKKSIIIPNSVTTIGDRAFYGNQLTSVEIPDSVVFIEQRAFRDNQLTSVTIPNSVTTIGWYAFENNQLTSVAIPSSVTTIDYGAFEDNQLTSVRIPNSVTTIGDRAFSNNSTLKTITIDNTSGAISGSPWGATNATINYLR